MQFVAQGVEDAGEVSVAADVSKARTHGFVGVHKVVAPLLQVNRDVLALGIDLHDLLVDGSSQVLQLSLAYSFDSHLHEEVVHTGIAVAGEFVHVLGAGHVASPGVIAEHTCVWSVGAGRL